MRIYVLVIIIVILSYSCNSFNFTDQPQGEINYEVIYLSNRSGMPTNLLPRKVSLKFRANKSITSITGFMGMFSLCNISDFRKHTNTMMLKVMDSKYFYSGEKYAPPFFFDGLKNLNIVFKNETKVLAGIKCKKAIISYADNTQPSFEVFYTDQIKIKNANKATPFSSIDGVLMQFNIRISNIEMKLVANKYKPEPVPEDIFIIPKDYKKVSREKLSGVLEKLLE
jgi:GLPGLI family protein